MNTEVDLKRVRWALEELSDEGEQRRLWLSDGSGGTEVSSLLEAQCGLFDDSRLGAAFDKKQPVFGDLTDGMFAKLGDLLRRVDGARHPKEIIGDPLMVEVRSLAASLMKQVPL